MVPDTKHYQSCIINFVSNLLFLNCLLCENSSNLITIPYFVGKTFFRKNKLCLKNAIMYFLQRQTLDFLPSLFNQNCSFRNDWQKRGVSFTSTCKYNYSILDYSDWKLPKIILKGIFPKEFKSVSELNQSFSLYLMIANKSLKNKCCFTAYDIFHASK